MPRKKLLVFEVREGWEPLCKFLGEERIWEDFPHVNDKKAYVTIFRKARNMVIYRVVANWLFVWAPFWIPLVGLMYMWWAVNTRYGGRA